MLATQCGATIVVEDISLHPFWCLLSPFERTTNVAYGERGSEHMNVYTRNSITLTCDMSLTGIQYNEDSIVEETQFGRMIYTLENI